jgi:hypothetical protein
MWNGTALRKRKMQVVDVKMQNVELVGQFHDILQHQIVIRELVDATPVEP